VGVFVMKNKKSIKLQLQSTLVISTLGISTLRICRRICNVPNSVPIHSIYIYPYKSTFVVCRHFAYFDMSLGPKQCFHALI